MRDLKPHEAEKFDPVHERSNPGFSSQFCCPHCLFAVEAAHPGDKFRVISCPSCKKEFVVWVDLEPVAKSAFVPGQEKEDW